MRLYGSLCRKAVGGVTLGTQFEILCSTKTHELRAYEELVKFLVSVQRICLKLVI